MPLLTLKTANELKKSYGDTFDKVLDFFEQKSHFLETFDTNAKTKLVPLLTLKRANGLKKSYGDTFDKVFDFFEQKYHFLETFDTKTQKLV